MKFTVHTKVNDRWTWILSHFNRCLINNLSLDKIGNFQRKWFQCDTTTRRIYLASRSFRWKWRVRRSNCEYRIILIILSEPVETESKLNFFVQRFVYLFSVNKDESEIVSSCKIQDSSLQLVYRCVLPFRRFSLEKWFFSVEKLVFDSIILSRKIFSSCL